MANVIKVKIPQLIVLIKRCLAAGLVPMIHGSPGIGKSSVGHFIADTARLKVIDERIAQSDPTDAKGFPHIDTKSGKAGYIPFDTFPLEGDPLPEIIGPDGKGTGQFYNGWLLFLDEINGAEKLTQGAYYKIILDRMVGRRKLHPACFIIAAGNLVTDGAIVEPQSTALQSRMVHFEVESPAADIKPWLEWAATHQIDHRITSYIGWKPDNLYAFKADHQDYTYACNRTWEFASKLLGVMTPDDWLQETSPSGAILRESNVLVGLAGCITLGVAREFVAFCRLEDQLPKMDEILLMPEVTRVPDEPSVQWMLTGALSHHMSQDNIARMIKYIQRLPSTFQVVTMKDAKRRKPQIVKTPAYVSWISTQSDHLF